MDDLRRGVDSMLSPFGIVAGAVACWAVSAVAMAQEAPTQAKDPQSLQDLAKTHKNPFAQSVNVPFELATGFGVGSERRTGESMNIQPVVPFSLTSAWTLVALPSLSVTYEPPPGEAFGLQDLQLSLILTPTRGDRWIWGIGPIFQFPSASTPALGTGKWSAGPTGGVAYSNGPWFNHMLASHLWSFGGDPARDPVNLTSVEILVSYNFQSGWYVQFDPTNSYDWTADSRNAWTIPVGLDVGKVWSLSVPRAPRTGSSGPRSSFRYRRASRLACGIGFWPDGPLRLGERPTKVLWRRDRSAARIP